MLNVAAEIYRCFFYIRQKIVCGIYGGDIPAIFASKFKCVWFRLFLIFPGR